MTNEQLAAQLKDDCERAGPGERVVTIHLFGIRNAAALKGKNLRAIATLAGIPVDYGTEIGKGVKLASYVDIKR